MVRAALVGAERVFTSDLTLVECARALVRAETLLELPVAEVARQRARLQAITARWSLLALGASVIERARQRFPVEPVRTLDALHLASALIAAESLEDLTVLSLDRRVRSSARALGLSVLPAS